MLNNEKEILLKIQQGNPKAFKKVYLEYHKKTYTYIVHFIIDPIASDNILQNVFISFWEMRDNLDLEIPIQLLLYRISKDKVFAYLRKTVKKNPFIKYCL